MYRINLDVVNNIVFIELAGSLQENEVSSYLYDLETLMGKFGTKELSIVVLAQRLDPLSQDIKIKFQKAIQIVINNAKKVAVVHGNRFMTKSQMKLIEQKVREVTDSDTKIARFSNRKDAMDYILK